MLHAAFPETRSQKIDDYSAVAKEFYDNRLKRLLDSTKQKLFPMESMALYTYKKQKKRN
jgi:hypothetical protein